MKYIYESVIEAAISDFEGFFNPNAQFRVNYKTANINGPAKVTGNEKGSTLWFNTFGAQQPIESLDDVMFCLIILGHELAHYVNKHVSHKDQSKTDSIAIEGWADNFGARITFTLITFGSAVSEIIDNLTAVPFAKPVPFKFKQEIILKAIGRALLRIYETVYKNTDGSGQYLKSSQRVFTFLAGVTAFFYRLWGDLNEVWLFYVYKRLAFDTKLTDRAYDPHDKMAPDALFERMREIHIQIKGEERFITAGMHPNFLNLIGTSYVDDPEERERRKDRLREEFKRWEFKFEL
ncbi:hypothetical protein EDC30_11846 [Paucimonas lemoignei]|uniref:Uncharacterized protein n=1 Tax=Paucimonas lemoignei TaxID=29443 RepID=A0A4R3HU77_PAULE|nr:hypothetical protein [Paucimonas lemoignei]TCS33105.1 hypothetical protein EDC30_11846 [Paucimonas lemoignei]